MNPQQTGRASSPPKQPKPPFPEQHLEGVGLEKDLQPRPRYEAESYRAAQKLEGKVALITGGDSGIGRAVAVL
ncbi:MAG TPA: short-chain dehydrogenase, partial [Casimicrobiaceae bacterium]|nr:short-chain dehydrogenase [Casimicrobiaceae bacterium]